MFPYSNLSDCFLLCYSPCFPSSSPTFPTSKLSLHPATLHPVICGIPKYTTKGPCTKLWCSWALFLCRSLVIGEEDTYLRGIPLVLRAENLQCAVTKHLVEASWNRNGTIDWGTLKLYSFTLIHTWRLRTISNSNIFLLLCSVALHSFIVALEVKETTHLIFVWNELIWYFPFIMRKQSSLKSFCILTICGSALI